MTDNNEGREDPKITEEIRSAFRRLERLPIEPPSSLMRMAEELGKAAAQEAEPHHYNSLIRWFNSLGWIKWFFIPAFGAASIVATEKIIEYVRHAIYERSHPKSENSGNSSQTSSSDSTNGGVFIPQLPRGDSTDSPTNPDLENQPKKNNSGLENKIEQKFRGGQPGFNNYADPYSSPRPSESPKASGTLNSTDSLKNLEGTDSTTNPNTISRPNIFSRTPTGRGLGFTISWYWQPPAQNPSPVIFKIEKRAFQSQNPFVQIGEVTSVPYVFEDQLKNDTDAEELRVKACIGSACSEPSDAVSISGSGPLPTIQGVSVLLFNYGNTAAIPEDITKYNLEINYAHNLIWKINPDQVSHVFGFEIEVNTEGVITKYRIPTSLTWAYNLPVWPKDDVTKMLTPRKFTIFPLNFFGNRGPGTSYSYCPATISDADLLPYQNQTGAPAPKRLNRLSLGLAYWELYDQSIRNDRKSDLNGDSVLDHNDWDFLQQAKALNKPCPR